MSPIGLIKYLVISGVIVVSFFVGFGLLMMSDDSREEYRNRFKHRFYISKPRFKVLTRITACTALLIGALASWFTIQSWLAGMAE